MWIKLNNLTRSVGFRGAGVSALFFLACFSTPEANAKDLHGRLGLGFNNQFSNSTTTNGVPGLSLKYGLTRDIAAAGIIGISTSTPSNTVTGLKLFKNIFFEQNLNFYFMVGGALVNGNHQSGADFLGGFGSEFFIPGVESLGFSVETGVRFTNITGSFVFQTLGVSFLEAGIHFYF